MAWQLNFAEFPLLSFIIWLPVAGSLLLLFVPRRAETLIKIVALAVALADFVASLPLWFQFDRHFSGFQFVEKHPWIKAFGVQYFLGVDGISVLFILLSALITILCILISWESITKKVKEFYISLLLTSAAMIGVFCSLDLFLFYIFWEAMLIPMYLIIGIWGGPRRLYATIKFFLYTLLGSVLMLIGIIVIYLKTGTFEIPRLMEAGFPYGLQILLFLAFFAAFAVKVPMWPVHTWLPDAHTEAPTAGSVILAGILIKMGAYGFLRFSLAFFPKATVALSVPMLVLSIIAIIYGGLACLAQSDLKRLIAYSSVSHMGFVTLGIFSLTANGVEGAILQMINHGVVTGALFMCVGIVYDRTHSREISYYGGLASVMPVYAAFFLVFTMASIGLPGTNGFVGEFLILLGTFTAKKWAAVFAALGVIIGACYMLWLYQRVFCQKINPNIVGLPGMKLRELVALLPMFILILWIGVYPKPFLSFMHQSVNDLLQHIHQAGSVTSITQLLKEGLYAVLPS
ncbi:NADH-quinone oxidoreductase subunit M [Thermosulfurimonas dismutans]|uniref:NADH-ubiquinone oxidoreductase chain M n=1 Tax=Thermosulfurimonas dismutans TaxID=999894 RepID=A0A179D5L5_9BACT|nr:NADH-quinone oxidoreductase subunit M [Thermosulfurimonas dismutans]OAQ20888.1 NADH-ubiquinone oxidoreductase chain M [Thermosulfurimonas dismutans]